MQKKNVVMYVYASDTKQTHETHFSKQGFGHGKELDVPIEETSYCWAVPFPSRVGDTLGVSAIHPTLEDSAQSLSSKYMTDFDSRIPKSSHAFEIVFSPPQAEVERNKNSNVTPRALSQAEEKMFTDAFVNANRAAMTRKTGAPRRPSRRQSQIGVTRDQVVGRKVAGSSSELKQ